MAFTTIKVENQIKVEKKLLKNWNSIHLNSAFILQLHNILNECLQNAICVEINSNKFKLFHGYFGE